MAADDPAFHVLLGPDYAGKSSVMTALRSEEPDWQLLSIDGAFLRPEHSLVADLRHALVGDVMPGLGDAYSLDFMATLMQAAVVHLRDRIRTADPRRPIVVDSYYYKILAKCRLAGLDESQCYTWWRTFPQPRSVVYLEVSARNAWRRCGRGAEVNRMEYYDDRPLQEGFATYQADLDHTMSREVAHLPVSVVHEQDSVADTVSAVRKALR
jgi:thymidylate kinase